MLRKVRRHHTHRLGGGMIGETINGMDSQEMGRRYDLDNILMFA
jgi:hypothetical protein